MCAVVDLLLIVTGITFGEPNGMGRVIEAPDIELPQFRLNNFYYHTTLSKKEKPHGGWNPPWGVS
jgi:hypothetical protein